MLQEDSYIILVCKDLILLLWPLNVKVKHITESKIEVNQLGFMKARGTTYDGLFATRRIIENKYNLRKM